jgi:hypothetical protein
LVDHRGLQPRIGKIIGMDCSIPAVFLVEFWQGEPEGFGIPRLGQCVYRCAAGIPESDRKSVV